MNKAGMIEMVCDYVLSQNHERENTVDELAGYAKELKHNLMPKANIKKELYEVRQNYIFYNAFFLLHGKRHANTAFKSCIADAMEKL